LRSGITVRILLRMNTVSRFARYRIIDDPTDAFGLAEFRANNVEDPECAAWVERLRDLSIGERIRIEWHEIERVA
jgi:hypothetical protein